MSERDPFGGHERRQPITREEFARWRDKISKALRKMEVILGICVLVFLGLGYWSIQLQISHNNDVAALQHQREASITESCKSQNERNTQLYQFLNKLPVAHTAPPRQKLLLNQFINALAPHEDCREVLLIRTGVLKPKHKPEPSKLAPKVKTK